MRSDNLVGMNRLEAYLSVIDKNVIEEARGYAEIYLQDQFNKYPAKWNDAELSFTKMFAWSASPQGHVFWQLLEIGMDRSFPREQRMAIAKLGDDPLF